MAHPVVITVLSGDELDGVRRYGRRLAEERAALGRPTSVVELAEPPGGWSGALAGVDAVHLHLSDRLHDEAPERWAELRRAIRASGAATVVTLHDVPHDAEGADRAARRRPAYVRLASGADLVVVSSRHERAALAAAGVDAEVVAHPLLLDAAPTGAPSAAERAELRTIVVAGFVHPGKGLLELVDAVGDVRGTALDGWSLRLVGDATAAHRHHLDEVLDRARRHGLGAVCTGALGAAAWSAELAAATVPVAPHAHCSASGSLLAWLAAGRRPLTSDHAFARELAAERPGCLHLVSADGWRDALLRAAADADPCELAPPGGDGAIGAGGWRSPRSAVDALDAAVRRRLPAAAPA